MTIAQDTVIRVNPGIWWVDSDMVFEGSGGHDNFALFGYGPCSRIALRNSATLTIKNMGRWSVSNIQIVKVSGSSPINHMYQTGLDEVANRVL